MAARPPIKKNDEVFVLRGKDRGKRGRVLIVIPKDQKIVVEGVQMIKRHTRPNPSRQIKGGIAERESPVAVSNVMIVCPGCNKPTRIGHHIDQLAGGRARRTRVCRKCGSTLDKK